MRQPVPSPIRTDGDILVNVTSLRAPPAGPRTCLRGPSTYTESAQQRHRSSPRMAGRRPTTTATAASRRSSSGSSRRGEIKDSPMAKMKPPANVSLTALARISPVLSRG